MNVAFYVIAGVPFGMIIMFYLGVRPLQKTIVSMYYAGFKGIPPAPPMKLSPTYPNIRED